MGHPGASSTAAWRRLSQAGLRTQALALSAILALLMLSVMPLLTAGRAAVPGMLEVCTVEGPVWTRLHDDDATRSPLQGDHALGHFCVLCCLQAHAPALLGSADSQPMPQAPGRAFLPRPPEGREPTGQTWVRPRARAPPEQD